MSQVWIVKRKHLYLAAAALLLLLSGLLYLNRGSIVSTAAEPTAERTIHMVAGEFKSTTADGKTIEAYRWDPGTVVVQKGERIKLSIYGVNGQSHPFLIEGLNISGEVKKGKETVVHFTADQEGTYRLICLTHTDIAHSGPMIGYIVVD
ncbi:MULTISPECIES: cupredoxin domain-containing protein [unclassified Paenibacillus]|uniref:cupredoxin domain-containing protein n=1 Tax=unclassified Paenibacillus TaxID=185978 RepID=UPI002788BE81|nr:MULTISPECIES: cupredoxin domain-containing protein [unclassified Paenibacillus]MDQ0902114.1 plastocyanin [Paenibacillus sp. V4I7]MDQ0919392.1 plastocyanin [Paenibacillus sp. V4I5]